MHRRDKGGRGGCRKRERMSAPPWGDAQPLDPTIDVGGSEEALLAAMDRKAMMLLVQGRKIPGPRLPRMQGLAMMFVLLFSRTLLLQARRGRRGPVKNKERTPHYVG